MPAADRALVDRVMARIDCAKLAAVAQRWDGNPFAKYFDPGVWVSINVERAMAIGLDRSPRRRVIDMGCGFGYFLLVARELGHDAIGVDLPEPLYQEARRALGVQHLVTEASIDATQPLPVRPRSGDVVTAHMICFNGHGTRSLWGVANWTSFLDQCVGAQLHLQLNAERDGTMYPQGVAELFGRRGGIIAERHVVFRRVKP